MNNTTNHVTNTLFSKKNEERVVNLLEKLVDHITATPLSKEHQDWLNSNDASHQQPKSPLESDKYRIRVLEKQLAEANSKLSQRF